MRGLVSAPLLLGHVIDLPPSPPPPHLPQPQGLMITKQGHTSWSYATIVEHKREGGKEENRQRGGGVSAMAIHES